MSIVKSLSVGVGDMFYIKHGSDNFTTIDCCLSDENKKEIVDELKTQSKDKGVTRFISTHPDNDHIQQLDYLDDNMPICNFYCVNNETTKDIETNGFKRYKALRDSSKAYNVSKGCQRKWMNLSGDGRDSSGINYMWPKTDNEDYIDALENAKNEESPNNISSIFTYELNESGKFIWMGDLETSFMEKIKGEISLPNIDILFAPHHGRKSGLVPTEWLEQMIPSIIVMGEAPSEHLAYAGYDDYNKITQHSAGDIVFECISNKVHIYVSNENYSVDFLDNENVSDDFDCYYLGTLNI